MEMEATERISVPKEGSKEKPSVEIEVVEVWCKGCNICVQVCPKDCLELDKNGKVAVVNLEGCSRCLLCELLCPDFAIKVR